VHVLKLGLGGLLLALPYSAWALFGDSVRPYVSYSVAHDSNYFRVANDAQAQALLGTGDTAVTSRTGEVGVDADLKFSRQTVALRANLNQTRFNRSELQSQDGYLLSADWQWVIGNKWNGNLRYLQARELEQQTDAVSTQAQTQDRNDLSFSANYQISPNYLLTAGAANNRSEFSPADRESLNRDENTQNLGVRFVTDAGNSIGLQYRRLDGRYVNRPAPTDQFEESEISLLANWRPSGLSQIQAQVGQTRRTENQIEQSTPSWNVTADWTPGGKTTLSVFVRRQITSSDTVTSASSSDTRSQGLTANWQLTGKTVLNAGYTLEKQDYTGITRRDDTQTTDLGLRYQALRSLSFGLNYQNGRRDSNLDSADYRYRLVTVNVLGSF
jgi:hypothetical protein